jgi:hypothetical protein
VHRVLDEALIIPSTLAGPAASILGTRLADNRLVLHTREDRVAHHRRMGWAGVIENGSAQVRRAENFFALLESVVDEHAVRELAVLGDELDLGRWLPREIPGAAQRRTCDAARSGACRTGD